MKIATLDNGTRDGQMVLVDRAQARCAPVPHIAPTLQKALDDWGRVLPLLQEAARALEEGRLEGSMPYQASRALAPLPRAYQWIDASGYLTHIERVRKARGAALPPGIRDEPIIYQGLSDRNLAWNAPLTTSAGWGTDFEGELAVLVDDVPQGVTAQEAARHIKLIVLVNDISLRELIPAELAKGFGFFLSKPASAYAPIAVTPDEFGDAWADGSLRVEMDVELNGHVVGRLKTGGSEQHFNFPAIIEYAARTRSLGAGSIVGAGTIANQDETRGAACLAEVRVMEQIRDGRAHTPWLRAGDRVRIAARTASGELPFGEIDQTVTQA